MLFRSAKGDWQRVRLYAQGQEVAVHHRIWEREQVRFEPVHYLALLERKPGALDHARPLAGWTLPASFGLLRRRLEAPWAGEGTREYIRVLRLLEKHSLPDLRAAVEKALAVGALTRMPLHSFSCRGKTGGGRCFRWTARALLDRLTHRVHILEANGTSYRLQDAKKRLKPA